MITYYMPLRMSNKTSIDWYNFVRDICTQYFIDHPSVIGGPGIEVEIDESMFGKRKYNRGRQVDGHWVFGGIESVWRMFLGRITTTRRQQI